ncbi:Outer membrane protein assembly factor BamA [Hydrogenovibrio crunogenus]|uniref:Outer membrane protein assembly factor BamA n=1 Tax=Hydrogenovibrio crunogenus TaxID=39765 RepID=A0A4P7P032_9GAMM|nr:Outer membrane protein assembly factor BamA [Hydrogenovibrio crunogenus]RUM91797.1 MAG: outer membrane protein assembly factor BamA [Thiomicrospira sp.]
MVKQFLQSSLLAFLLLFNLSVVKASDFQINKIQIEGNQRISFETVRSYLPIEVGDELSRSKVQKSIQALYQTGFFRDIAFFQEADGILKIRVLERPSIADISIEGNELIKTEDMTQALNTMGVKKGRIFNDTQMERIILDLRRRYQNQGYYAAEIDIQVKELPRNRVSLEIKVEEGKPASIGRITLVGNKTYDDARLKGNLLLSESAIIGDSDKYAKPKLQSDIETLRSYYMDRGFAEFKVASSQVSLSLDKTQVYITINMKEGVQYTVSDIKFTGETIVKQDELKSLLKIHEGDFFSRSQIVATVNAIRDRLSEEGYAFAEIEPITQLDKNNRLVSLDFRIEPKSRVYVRRIRIEGNTRTRDYVIRRELRQFENAPYSLKAVRRSNTRLNRLGYFKTAKVDTDRISKDQVDLVVKVEEQSTGAFNAGIGYSQLDGISFTIGVTERNVIGSGYRANVNGTYSASTKSADIGVTNPYFTADGVSLGGGLYYREIDAQELNVSNYTTNNYGLRVNVGYPTSEWSSLSYGLKFDDQTLKCIDTFTACKTYTSNYGRHFNSVRYTMGWSYDTKNAFYFPTDGQRTSVSGELVMPTNSDVSFYKLYLEETLYQPLSQYFTLRLKGDVAYGDGYGDHDELPFYENFYAGGIGTVRGFEPNSLGPRYDATIDGSTDPIGGSLRIVTNAEVTFPMPFVEDSGNLRLSLFVDAGNVFSDASAVKLPEFRSAAGLGVAWITPVGPLAFSLAKALNYQDTDRTQVFQFNLGVPM